MENNYCVYCHTNKINGKQYVGITKYGNQPQKRWHGGSSYCYSNNIFGSAIKKYGWENFEHTILKNSLSKDEAFYWEQYYIKELHTWIRDPECNGYNITPGGGGYYDPSEEQREKMRQISTALWQDEEYRRKNLEGRKKYTWTEEHRKNFSNALKGRTLSEEHKKHLSESRKGVKFTEEHKKHLSENSGQAKKVICIETGEIFNSCTEAAAAMGLSQGARTHISRVCKGLEKSAGKHPITKEKLHWKYYKGEDEE